MKTTVLTTTDGTIVCERCSVAANPFARMRGLLGRSSLASGEGILLRPAASVHTGFMRFAIDVVFLDRELNVLRIVARLAPWCTAARRKAHSVLELPAGECERRGLNEGDRIELG